MSRVSLILTVLNESKNIPQLVDFLGSQSGVIDEVVIVDGGSTDGTVEQILALTRSLPIGVSVKHRPGANISAGRNAAIAESTGDIILVTDAGARPCRNWAHELICAMDCGADVASGFFVPESGRSFSAVLGTIILPMVSEIEPAGFLPSSRSVAFTREAWRRGGGYPEWLDHCEDLVFDIAMREAGMRFVFVPEALVTWDARSSLKSFMKQYYRYARGDGLAGLWARRHAVRYAAYAVGLRLACGGNWERWFLGLLAAVYLLRPGRRIIGRRDRLGARGVVKALILSPALQGAGDISKMVGYPVGLFWRIRRRGRIFHDPSDLVAV